MMQAAEPGKGHDLPHDGRLDGSVFRGILGQGQVATILVVPGGELGKQATGMSFVEHDEGAGQKAYQGEHPGRIQAARGSLPSKSQKAYAGE